MKFDIEHFYENLGGSPKLVKIGQQFRTLHMKVYFILFHFILFFAATLNRLSLRLKLYQAVCLSVCLPACRTISAAPNLTDLCEV